MFWRYSGNGNSTPSVLTVATSLPVDGVSPGSGGFWGVVRGAASRRLASGVGGGAARETVLLGGGRLVGAGGVSSSASRGTASGARRSSCPRAGAASSRTRYVRRAWRGAANDEDRRSRRTAWPDPGPQEPD